MAGCSIVVLNLLLCLFLWPVLLVLLVIYLVSEAAALVVTSPAFPAMVVAMLSCSLGCLDAAIVLWKHFKAADPDGDRLSIKQFKRTIVLFVISFVAACAAVALLGITVFSLFSAS